MGVRRDWSEVEAIITKIHEHGLSYKQGAREYGISVSKLYEYNKRMKRQASRAAKASCTSSEERVLSSSSSVAAAEAGVEASSSQGELPSQIQDLIVRYRTEHPDHGYRKIENYLKHQCFLVISRKKIRETLKDRGLLSSNHDSSFDTGVMKDRTKGTRRFEAPYPRSLYQLDVTYVYLNKIPVLYLVGLVDDYSRYCVAAELMNNQRGVTMIEILHRAFERYGKPERLLTDQGSSFYSWSHEQTQFQSYLDDQCIEHIVADPHSPQTLGKVERWNQTIQRELLHKVRFGSYQEACDGIAEYVNSYNYTRPHQGIGGAYPASRFHGIAGEVSRLESELFDPALELSKGYLIMRNPDHTISVVYSSKGIEIYRDGNLLREGDKSAQS